MVDLFDVFIVGCFAGGLATHMMAFKSSFILSSTLLVAYVLLVPLCYLLEIGNDKASTEASSLIKTAALASSTVLEAVSKETTVLSTIHISQSGSQKNGLAKWQLDMHQRCHPGSINSCSASGQALLGWTNWLLRKFTNLALC